MTVVFNSRINCLISLLRQNFSTFPLPDRLLPFSVPHHPNSLFPRRIITAPARWKDVQFTGKAGGVYSRWILMLHTYLLSTAAGWILSQPIFIIGNFLLNVKLYYKQDQTDVYCIYTFFSIIIYLKIIQIHKR